MDHPTRGWKSTDVSVQRFVVNIISESFIEAANYTSIDSPAEVDEWKLSGLTPVPSSWTDTPGPPRVGESAYALECELYDSINFHSDRDPSRQTANLVLGRITKFVIKKSTLMHAVLPSATRALTWSILAHRCTQPRQFNRSRQIAPGWSCWRDHLRSLIGCV